MAHATSSQGLGHDSGPLLCALSCHRQLEVRGGRRGAGCLHSTGMLSALNFREVYLPPQNMITFHPMQWKLLSLALTLEGLFSCART